MYRTLKLTEKTRAVLINSAQKTKAEWRWFNYQIIGDVMTVWENDFLLKNYSLENFAFNAHKAFLISDICKKVLN